MMTRALAAAAVMVSAGVHLYLWFDGYRDLDVVGPAFLLNAVGGVVIALLLLAWRHWFAALLAVGFGLTTLSAFVISATVGLFGVEESWTGWAVWTAAVSEVVAVVTGALLLLEANRSRSQGELQHHATFGRAHLH